MSRLRDLVRENRTNPNAITYVALVLVGVLYPVVVQFITGGNGNYLVSLAADAGVFVLMAIGLNVVVGFAGLLDLGYAAFFAIGAYAYGLLASQTLVSSPLHHAVHLSFWIGIFVALFLAAGFGVVLGAPTLRLRGDYLAIVTLGFGEIVPLTFKNLPNEITGGVNGITAIDPPQLPGWVDGPWLSGVGGLNVVSPFDINATVNPTAFYVIMLVLIALCVVLVNNLYGSRLGRAWMAIREDEVAAAAMGVNTVTIKLLAFSIGAAFSGFAGAFYGAKLSIVTPESFGFVVSVTILVMVVLGGMGNIPGVIVGAILVYFVLYWLLPNAPQQAVALATNLGLTAVVNPAQGTDWPGIGEEINRIKYLIFGVILVSVMLLRPQGLLPSALRRAELTRGTTEGTVFDSANTEF